MDRAAASGEIVRVQTDLRRLGRVPDPCSAASPLRAAIAVAFGEACLLRSDRAFGCHGLRRNEPAHSGRFVASKPMAAKTPRRCGVVTAQRPKQREGAP